MPKRARKKPTRKKPTRKKTTHPSRRIAGPGFVYILQSKANPARTYVGVTNDIGRRIRQHNGHLAGGARSTTAFRPWFVHSLFQMPTRREALSLEWQIKHKRRRSDGPGVLGRVAAAERLARGFATFRRVF
jgi:predicted GIY-YIG superfamily endonuclease